jgi:hypothetical protein
MRSEHLEPNIQIVNMTYMKSDAIAIANPSPAAPTWGLEENGLSLHLRNLVASLATDPLAYSLPCFSHSESLLYTFPPPADRLPSPEPIGVIAMAIAIALARPVAVELAGPEPFALPALVWPLVRLQAVAIAHSLSTLTVTIEFAPAAALGGSLAISGAIASAGVPTMPLAGAVAVALSLVIPLAVAAVAVLVVPLVVADAPPLSVPLAIPGEVAVAVALVTPRGVSDAARLTVPVAGVP